MYRNILALALYGSCCSAVMAQAGETPVIQNIRDIPNVDISYYDVSGTNGVQVRQEINRLRPIDPVEKKPFDGLANYSYGWGWPIDANGKCQLDRAKLTFKANITLPRLTSYAALNAALQKRWDRYEKALADFQFVRVSHAYSHKDALLAAIKGASCDNANDVANNYLADIAKSGQDYVNKAKAKAKKERVESASFP